MISLKELRDRLGLKPPDDDQIKILRTDVIALWEARTNRLWNKRDGHVEEFQLEETYERKASVWLELSPILSIGKIEMWDDGNEANLDELTTDEYKTLVNVSKITRIPRGALWLRNVRVTYDGGVDETTTPDDIQETLALQALYILHRHRGEKSVLSGISGPAGGVSFMVSADVHPHFKAQAKLHRRHR